MAGTDTATWKIIWSARVGWAELLHRDSLPNKLSISRIATALQARTHYRLQPLPTYIKRKGFKMRSRTTAAEAVLSALLHCTDRALKTLCRLSFDHFWGRAELGGAGGVSLVREFCVGNWKLAFGAARVIIARAFEEIEKMRRLSRAAVHAQVSIARKHFAEYQDSIQRKEQ
ncbi:hypothetical protein EVAR_18515_1 [Eumeta japonica]|uniref:Uncharacterized protein n=1 Tax=Eumeta variegata TaxID=151549 RepID=A0A4C1V116_EUMVA|nr:hypothetical protein EVAR_18515_1 [Eumeta japonica]